eukprot:gnl/Chilomastix_cuspidata/7533.p1 GENE.gnl/Chilomastix_cuspidata/7533~~gnl/Chilomastix_cuspidata/7533.p1  ORF type:complete len:201 (+),score=23.30 gnl/Chilomastix_cuspidata/7533:89-691(+)
MPSQARKLGSFEAHVFAEWLLQNFDNPYPRDKTIRWMMERTSADMTQVKNWFCTHRYRLKDQLLDICEYMRAFPREFQEFQIRHVKSLCACAEKWRSKRGPRGGSRAPPKMENFPNTTFFGYSLVPETIFGYPIICCRFGGLKRKADSQSTSSAMFERSMGYSVQAQRRVPPGNSMYTPCYSPSLYQDSEQSIINAAEPK